MSLVVTNLTKQYTTAHGILHALKGVSMQVPSGAVVGLLGVNGAGKTTLTNIIATAIAKSSGNVSLHGYDSYQQRNEYRQRIGWCPQQPNFLPYLTVHENLCIAGELWGLQGQVLHERIEEVAEQLGIQHHLHRNPATLSGGYVQRCMIARSILHRPQLVLLDEPTVALDPHIRYQVWDVIKQLQSIGTSILLTTHYLEEAEQLAQYIYVLHQGLIAAHGSPQEVMQQFATTTLENVLMALLNCKDAA